MIVIQILLRFIAEMHESEKFDIGIAIFEIYNIQSIRFSLSPANYLDRSLTSSRHRSDQTKSITIRSRLKYKSSLIKSYGANREIEIKMEKATFDDSIFSCFFPNRVLKVKTLTTQFPFSG